MGKWLGPGVRSCSFALSGGTAGCCSVAAVTRAWTGGSGVAPNHSGAAHASFPLNEAGRRQRGREVRREARASRLHIKQGNPHVDCNALSKTRDSLNCYLTPAQAIEFARHLLQKAQLILDHQLEGERVVHIWNVGERSEKLYVGWNQPRKGPRRKKRRPAGAAGAHPAKP